MFLSLRNHLFIYKKLLGWSETVQHFWCNTLLISALLSKKKEVVGENNSVAPTMLFSFTLNPILDGVRAYPIFDGGEGGQKSPPGELCHLVSDNNETW